MNSMEPLAFRLARKSCSIIWPLFLVCLAFTWCRPVSAADPYYINNAIVSYPGTVSTPPQIDAINFVNNDSFTINFTTLTINNAFYGTSDTLNYTNNGEMVCNSGFQFDTLSSDSGVHSRAASFSNPGSISCGSINDATAVLLFGFGQCLVNATNILNPGSVDVGTGGLIQLTGQNVDLSQSLLTVEGGGANVGGVSVAGLNTNFWDPSFSLGPTTAQSAFFPLAPIFLTLTNSTAYFDGRTVNGTNVIRAVFLQDTSPSNVSASVYFDPNIFDSVFGGRGAAIIQWAGSYLDTASGNIYSNYFYLQDDYFLGASTNVQIIGGVPDNFSFFESTTPLALPPATAPGFFNVFFPGTVTNRYVFGDLQLLASPSTNLIANQSVTNLPGRVQISGDDYLNLSNAQITGQSYMSLVSTNNFAGSGGAVIQTPYSDLNLGQRNGILFVTNTMQANLPFWGGGCQVWSTRWVDVIPGVATNDYRVLLVGSQLTPTIAAQVQNLILRDYSSNNIVISDTFNVMNSFYADAQSLTLTTNAVGNGATSLDGELNLGPAGIFWQSSVPNLRFLTNNGAIRMNNLAYFGNATFTNSVAGGTLSELFTSSNAVAKDIVTVGTNNYMFVTTLTNSVPNQVAIVPNSFDGSLSNLIKAINKGLGAGVAYSTASAANPVATAGPLVNHAFSVTAISVGTNGSSIPLQFTAATHATNLAWQAQNTVIVPFIGNNALINNGIWMDQGSIMYAANFQCSGVFSNGSGSMTLQSLTTTLTNLILQAGGDVSITADSLVTSNLMLQAPRSLTLTATNVLTTGQTNNSVWSVGSASVGTGISMPVKPVIGDLLGTTITLSAPTNRTVVNTWAGTDYGISPTGYTNNEAVEQMIFDVAALPIAPFHNGFLNFNGASTSNALYVDLLVLTNYATQGNSTNNYNFPWLRIGNNMMIYFARAVENVNGQQFDVSEAIDQQSKIGANGGRLRWINSYTGLLTSTNFYSTNSLGVITTNTVNISLAQSSTIDSDGDGLVNALDPTPFFTSPELNLNAFVATNQSKKFVKVQWISIPNATNFIYYTTNLLSTNAWLPFTNFTQSFYGKNATNSHAPVGNSFISPQPYLGANASLPDNAYQTNVWVTDAITNVPHYYKVVVWPWVSFPY